MKRIARKDRPFVDNSPELPDSELPQGGPIWDVRKGTMGRIIKFEATIYFDHDQRRRQVFALWKPDYPKGQAMKLSPGHVRLSSVGPRMWLLRDFRMSGFNGF